MFGRSDGSVIIDIEGRTDIFNAALSGAKKAAAAAGKVIVASLKAVGAAVGTVSAGITAIGSKIVSEYADYEQLTGGVETLFKTSSEQVMQYAENAYKTAGMSANEYMETVTGFAASLVSSLGGDTEKAAQYADMALTDMSDNANKMGSDMESLKNAYAGFSKQNYTMLDNLKLGYGGTKEEMQRLLDKAEELSGIKFDISSYADIVQAIHIIQENMDIAGTTAKEAEATISGSIGMLKASFENLLAGMGNAEADIQGLIDKVVEAFNTVVNNIAPIADNIIAALPSAFAKISDALNAQLPGLLNTVVNAGAEIVIVLANGINDNIGTVIGSAEDILSALINTLSELIPTTKDVAAELTASLCTFILNNAADIVQVGMDLITALLNGLYEAIPQIVPAAVSAVMTIAETITDPVNIILIVDAALSIIEGLVTGLLSPESLKTIADGALTLIGNIAADLLLCVGDVLVVGTEICMKIAEGIAEYDWYTEFYNFGARISQAINAGFDSGEPIDLSKYSGKTKEYLEGERKRLIQEADGLSAAWEDYTTGTGLAYDSLDEYIAANIHNANGQALAAIKAEAEQLGYTGAELGLYVKERIDELQGEANSINAAIGAGVYAVEAAGQSEYEKNRSNFSAVFPEMKNDIDTTTKTFAEAIAEQDHLLAIHQITEEQYYKNLGDILTEYEDRSSEEWWKIYDEVEGYNQKIAKSNQKAADELKKTNAQVSAEFKEFYEALDLARAMGDITDEEFIAQLDAKLNSSAEYKASAYKSYWDKVTSAKEQAANEAARAEEQAEKERQNRLKELQKELEQKCEQAAKERLDRQKKAASAELEQFKSDTDRLTAEYSEKLSELQRERDSFKGKLSENIFSTETVTDEHGNSKKIGGVADIKKKISARKELGKYLENLVKKGIPKGMLSELAAMDPADGLEFAKQLDGMKDDKWTTLKADYNEYERINEEVAKQVYAPQITALNEQYKSDMETLLDGVTEGAAAAGAQTVKEYLKGIDSASEEALSDITEKLEEVTESISDSISDVSLFKDVDTTTVGGTIAEGIAEGISSKSDLIKKSLEAALSDTDIMSLLTSAVNSKSAGYTPASSSTVTNINNNVVNNNKYTAQGGGSSGGVTNLTVNLLWKDGTKLAEIVNAANNKIAIATGG